MTNQGEIIFLLQDNYFYCKAHEKKFKKHLYNI